ncbi:MAG: hypothetical protein JKY56_24130 [Kofleriaceae bacterium]|nr:hypothetical protein [Kofleriaceae bacterium]
MTVLGIDIGTQSLKVIVVRDGVVLGQSQSALMLSRPRPNWAQQDPLEWDRALPLAIAAALSQASVHAGEIAAIGIVGQLDGCLAVDRDGQALSDCLVWMDRRANAMLPAMSAAENEHFRQCTGLVMDGSHMAAKIKWLKTQGLPAEARFHQPTSYLVERLCGAFVMDSALASTTMLYSLSDEGYDEELLELFSVSRSEIPKIAAPGDIAGHLTSQGAALCGLPAGIPLAVGTGDDFATLLGAGITKPGPMLCTLGTAEVVGALSINKVIDSGGLLETHRFLDKHYVENPGWLSGGALRWLGTILKIDSDAELDRSASCAPIGCDGLTFIPALSGAMAPSWQPAARGCFYGLTAGHTQSHMARAVLEGCAFAMRDVREGLLKMGLGTESIILLGGGAKSQLWAQMRSDLCQTELFASENDDSCALGAAILATAAYQENDATSISQSWEVERVAYQPRPTLREPYQQAYGRYRQLFAALSPMWDGS